MDLRIPDDGCIWHKTNFLNPSENLPYHEFSMRLIFISSQQSCREAIFQQEVNIGLIAGHQKQT